MFEDGTESDLEALMRPRVESPTASEHQPDDELTFEQMQEIDRLSKLANTPSSNSNKYRHQLYAYVNQVTAETIESYKALHRREMEELLERLRNNFRPDLGKFYQDPVHQLDEEMAKLRKEGAADE